MMNESQEIRRLTNLLEQEPPRGSSNDWIENIYDIRNLLSELETRLHQMHLAPSIDAKYRGYLKDMHGYFRDLSRHHDQHQNPSPRRLGR